MPVVDPQVFLAETQVLPIPLEDMEETERAHRPDIEQLPLPEYLPETQPIKREEEVKEYDDGEEDEEPVFKVPRIELRK